MTGGDWLQEFDWPGTRDPSPWLAAPAGLDFMHDVLGVEAMREHNHALAWQGAAALARRWGREWVTPESMVGCMVTVPLPARLGPPTRPPRSASATRCSPSTRSRRR